MSHFPPIPVFSVLVPPYSIRDVINMLSLNEVCWFKRLSMLNISCINQPACGLLVSKYILKYHYYY